VNNDIVEYAVIYLAPQCLDCINGDRWWCQDDIGPCEDCGRQSVRYILDRKENPDAKA
jgi:hypothetical protein